MVAAITKAIWYAIPQRSTLKPVTKHALTIPIGHTIEGFMRNGLEETIVYVGRVFGASGRAFHSFSCKSGVSGVKIEEAVLARDYQDLVSVSNACKMTPLRVKDVVLIKRPTGTANQIATITEYDGIFYRTAKTGDEPLRRDTLALISTGSNLLRDLPDSPTPFVLTQTLAPTLSLFFDKCDVARQFSFTAPEHIKNTISFEEHCWQQQRIA